jgi:hypothetical protein
MSEKYYAISLYGYCLNSPIKYIDKHGEKIVDTCGHIVYNLKTGWTKYATNNAKRIGTAMLKTHTGKTQWYKMAKSNVKITLDISSKSIETSKSVYRLGLSNSMFVGKKLYSSIITVYEGSLNSLMNDKSINNQIITSMYKNKTITIDEKIAAIVGHEAEHNINNENIKLRLEGNAPGVEDAPNKIEEQILKETLENHEN